MEITGIKDKVTLGVRRFFLSEDDKRLDKLGILKDVREFERAIKELEREKNRLEKEIEAVKNDNSISEKDRYEKLSVLQTDLKKVEGELAAQSQNKRILINYRNDIESLYVNPDDKLLENLKFENEIYSKMRNAMQDSLKSYAEKVYLKEEKDAEIKREADSFLQSESLSFNDAYNNLSGVAQPQPQPKQNQQPQPQPKQNQQPQPQPKQNQQPQPQPSQTNSSLDLTQFGIEGITCMEDFDKITDPDEKLAKLYQLHKAFKEVIGKQIKETKEKIEEEAKAKAEAEAKAKAEAEAKAKAEEEAKAKAEAEAKEKAEAEAKRLAEEAEKEEAEEAKRRKGNEARNKGKKRSRDKNREDIEDAEITPADVEGAAKTIRTGIDQSQAQEPSQTQEPLQDNDNDRGE